MNMPTSNPSTDHPRAAATMSPLAVHLGARHAADGVMQSLRRKDNSLPGAIKPVRTTDLVTHVTTDLRNRILDGQLPPDSDLPPEGRLAEMYNVSRTVVREAMRHLRSQGLVTVGRGRKPRVNPVSSQAAIETLNTMLRRSDGSVMHLLEVRRALEGEVASLAARRATDEQVASVVQANEDLRQAAGVAQRIRCDWLFHERLAEASNNPLFVLLVQTVAGLFQELMRRTSHSDTAVVYAAHNRLIDALRRHDPDGARRIALDNLELTRHDLEAH